MSLKTPRGEFKNPNDILSTITTAPRGSKFERTSFVTLRKPTKTHMTREEVRADLLPEMMSVLAQFSSCATMQILAGFDERCPLWVDVTPAGFEIKNWPIDNCYIARVFETVIM
jgi:hypothetical protein